MQELSEKIKQFSEDRDWQKFHTPKNLAAAISIESSELLEHFLWLTPEQSRDLDADKKQKVADEVGDILIYLTNFCNQLDIDPVKAAHEKLKKAALKYPVEKAKGIAKKYNEL